MLTTVPDHTPPILDDDLFRQFDASRDSGYLFMYSTSTPRLTVPTLSIPALFAVVWLAGSFVTRGALAVALLWSGEGSDATLFAWTVTFAKGFAFDLAALAFLAAPVLIYEALLPTRLRRSRAHHVLRLAWYTLAAAALLVLGISEWLFWDEFQTRFNFIAVDYLVYTQEVIGNIRESYPMPCIWTGIACVVGLFVWLTRRALWHADRLEPSWPRRAAYAAVATSTVATSLVFANVDQMAGSGNTYLDELSGNGLFSLSAAMRRNELDYDRFYRTIPAADAERVLSELGVTAGAAFAPRPAAATSPAAMSPPHSLRPARPRHVVMVSVESLSAEYLGFYNPPRADLTPQLDRLAAEGLVFTRMFATGTRTVRGLEALSIGTPPIPGQSIVRRPRNEHIGAVGGRLEQAGFDPYFVYGGYGFFDNMNAYFAGNDYRVLDRTGFAAASVAFENVWGVADESLFANAIGTIDTQAATGRAVFMHIMTTSNHRPFTYPEGRIDIASPGGREGGVKYSDYAIGEFVKAARTKPWFDETLFIFIADHCASAAGRTTLPVARYHIPLIFYAPALVKPGTIDRLVSQIDIPPTIMDLLGQADHREFFGRSLFAQDDVEPRAFISNYQELGYYKHDVLTVLSPRRRVTAFTVDAQSFKMVPVEPREDLVGEAVAYYQSASSAFKRGAMRIPLSTRAAR